MKALDAKTPGSKNSDNALRQRSPGQCNARRSDSNIYIQYFYDHLIGSLY